MNRMDGIKAEMVLNSEGKIKNIVGEIARYFESLFTFANPGECYEVLEGVPKTITEAMNRNLTRTIENQEIKHALFSMHPHTAPGPNGIPPNFFQKY